MKNLLRKKIIFSKKLFGRLQVRFLAGISDKNTQHVTNWDLRRSAPNFHAGKASISPEYKTFFSKQSRS
jgi:hypothetical protein